jgi:hypothetical protein
MQVRLSRDNPQKTAFDKVNIPDMQPDIEIPLDFDNLSLNLFFRIKDT